MKSLTNFHLTEPCRDEGLRFYFQYDLEPFLSFQNKYKHTGFLPQSVLEFLSQGYLWVVLYSRSMEGCWVLKFNIIVV